MTVAPRNTSEMISLASFGYPEVPCLGRYVFSMARHGLHYHQHSGAMEICFLLAGEQVYRTGARDYILKPGDIFVTHPDEFHGSGGYPQGKGSLHWIQVRFPPQGRSFLGLPATRAHCLIKALRGIRERCFRGDPRIAGVFDQVQDRSREPATPLTRLVLGAKLTELLTLVVESSAVVSAAPAETGLNRVLAYIENNMNEPLPLADLAKVAHLSLSRFEARFKQETGFPPAQYVLRKKMAKASAMLASGKHSVTDVAYSLGFSSSQYFATVFKRYSFKCPREFLPVIIRKPIR